MRVTLSAKKDLKLKLLIVRLWAPSPTRVCSRNCVLDGVANWHQLVNTNDRSVRGGDATSCQITLTTCVHFTSLRIYRPSLQHT